MDLFSIDREKCGRDGVCAAVCPVRIIGFEADSGPFPVEGAGQRCIRCGHCVAVCPHAAFSHSAMGPDDCPSVTRRPALGPAEAEYFFRFRRSIRNYTGAALDREEIARLLNAVRYAPTGTNSQRIRWLVVCSRETVKKLAGQVIDWMSHAAKEKMPVASQYHMSGLVRAWKLGYDIITRGAPGLIIAHAPEDYGIATIDSTIALSYLDLAAPSFGLGTCWAGFFMMAVPHWEPLRSALGLPDGHACYGAMMLGHPEFQYQRLPLRDEAKISWLE